MDGIELTLLATLVGSIALLLLRRRSQRQRLPVTHHSVRCPIRDDRAEVAVATDAAARSARQYVAVTGCSLLPDAAIGLPERFAYLGDGPPCRVRLEPASSYPLYTAEVSCRQPCVVVLNMTAVSGERLPLRCTSGVSDAIALAEQALGSPRMSRLLWYASL
jgi:hypothetical protein